MMIQFVFHLALLLIIAVSGCGSSELPSEKFDELFLKAQTAYEHGKIDSANQTLKTLLNAPPENQDDLLKLALFTRELGQPAEAIKLFEKLAKIEDASAFGQCMMADTYAYDLGQAADAEITFRKVLDDAPRDGMANEGLGHLLQVQGRVHESVPFLIQAIRNGRISARNLIVLGWTQVPAENPDALKRFLKHNPRDAHALLGFAIIDSYHNRIDSALKRIQNSVELNPQNLEAQALLGELLLKTQQHEKFQSWFSALPEDAQNHPDILLVLGNWAESVGDSKAAGRAYLKSLKQNPDDQNAAFRLGNILVKLGQTDAAKKYLERASKLEAYSLLLGKVHDNGIEDNPQWIAEGMIQCKNLGRLDEAVGWCHLALMMSPRNQELMAFLTSLKKKLPRQIVSRTRSNPFLSEDLFPEIALPNPATGGKQIELTGPSNPSDLSAIGIQFEDRADDVGIQFQYFNAANSTHPGFRMYESMGGGGAAIDFDVDGFPDLYFTNGSNWPPGGDREHRDVLYQSFDGSRYSDVTDKAGILATQFGQGVASGDINGDGLPDLYIANIGRNQLWLNNGDGTFSNVTDEYGLNDAQWTASAAMADINGDGLAEIYDVNYLKGNDLFTRDCQDFGRSNNCRPALFEPAQDQLYFNTGAAPLKNVTQSSGIVVPDGNGLGIIIAQLDDQTGNDVFVANDFVPNFYFSNSTNAVGETPVFVEQARLAGLAYDRDGRYQACMGVAFGDADNNGLPDFFVTNFSDESNTLYSQIEVGFYEDETRNAKLRDGSFNYVGFGTQFIDADLDSRPDLIITNGGLSPTAMRDTKQLELPSQFFWNRSGEFVELASDSLGPFFSKRVLGRGLFYVDWNRDGLDDVGISFLDHPVTLLTNTTRTENHFLSVRLVGTTSERIPHGTRVRVQIGDQNITRQLSAGDGYMASNSKELIFGLGSASKCDQIQVTWPNGDKQIFSEVDADQRILLIEGRENPLQLKH